MFIKFKVDFELRSHLLSAVSDAIDLKARSNFNCKAVEVTETEEVNGLKNHR